MMGKEHEVMKGCVHTLRMAAKRLRELDNKPNTKDKRRAKLCETREKELDALIPFVVMKPESKSKLVQQLEARIIDAEDRSWDRRLTDCEVHIAAINADLPSANVQYVTNKNKALRATMSRMLIAVVGALDALDG